MQVRLVSLTKSFISMEELLTPEELIIYIARVSNPANQMNHGTAPKLIKYMVDNKHWSPFEMVDMTVEIKTSRAIAQQILRHRSFSFQEFSQRYASVLDIEPVQIRRQADKNRQSSTEDFNPYIENEGSGIKLSASSMIEDHIAASQKLYAQLLDAGVAKECARMVLPLTTETTIYMKGSIRSWIHYFGVRCDGHAQREHQDVAFAILDIFMKHFPNISNAMGYEQSKV